MGTNVNPSESRKVTPYYVPTGSTVGLIGASVRRIAATLTCEILSLPIGERREPKRARDFSKAIAASVVGKAIAPIALTEGAVRVSVALPRESAIVAIFALYTGESATPEQIEDEAKLAS